MFYVWIPILTDASLGIHQTVNCCVPHGWFVCCTSALQHMDYFGAVSGAGRQSQRLGMSLWAALGCAISPLATAEWSLVWDTARGLKTIRGFGGSPSATATWLPPKSVCDHLWVDEFAHCKACWTLLGSMKTPISAEISGFFSRICLF